jgi:hypothetical protein
VRQLLALHIDVYQKLWELDAAVSDMNTRAPRPVLLESFTNLMSEIEGRMSTVVVCAYLYIYGCMCVYVCVCVCARITFPCVSTAVWGAGERRRAESGRKIPHHHHMGALTYNKHHRRR